MKLLFISDIHGIKTNLEKIKIQFIKNNCDYLVVLGDIFSCDFKDKNHTSDSIKQFLLDFKGKLICLKGNCDSLKDLEKLKIENNDKELYQLPKTNIYLTHGHKYNEFNWSKDNTILITGHTHIPKISRRGNNIFLNPGSISKSRAATKESYLIYNNGNFIIYDIEDNIIDKI